ncbi:MAG: transporter ATP-binding protein [Mucilaginibacter sp.]|nr:transporter ATP-binding protein [Mucilaginibacter sp.]
MDCGPSCIRMIAKHYGCTFSMANLKRLTKVSKDGVSMLSISKASESLGFKSTGAKITYETLVNHALLPCILHWNQNHFVVLYKISRQRFYIADPGKGKIVYKKADFLKSWISTSNNGEGEGVVLFLEPTDRLLENQGEKEDGVNGFSLLLKYLQRHKKLLYQLCITIFTASVLQFIFPFLTQSIVDKGILTRQINYIYIILLAQLSLFLGSMSLDFFRVWILLHISSRINVNILSDFLAKLMRLPVSFFDTKLIGDIMQRINDHKRIESFLTGTSINTFFSLVNLLFFGLVLLIYNKIIFLIFLAGSIFYVAWVLLFMKKRKKIDYQKFEIAAISQNKTVELITGMEEIKMNLCEVSKRWEWESLQARLFKLNIKSLSLNTYQQQGATFINQAKNIFITFIAATSVIKGDLTLGQMVAIEYIVGILNGPIEQLVNFLQSGQDAKLSLERLSDINSLSDEEPTGNRFSYQLGTDKNLTMKNVSFSYPGVENQMVLKNINLHIPQGKITAIVGSSGSGKTTLLKLLLKSHQATTGEIKIGDESFQSISPSTWRLNCGTVLQDGYIFSDSILKNISLIDDDVDMAKMKHAVKIAAINDFIDSLPLGYNTKIGNEGVGLSQGQRQRILIARAVYKNPDFLFFDEATNSLDANNESQILKNLGDFFKGKTVVIVAHRLSTIRNAHQIVVLSDGEIIEMGSHQELLWSKKQYYKLIKNQLELETLN